MLTDLSSTTADTVLESDPRPGVTGTLAIEHGGTGAVTAAGAAENIVDGQDIEPASVAATGEVSGKSGTTTHKLTEKAEDSDRAKLEASLAYVESTTARTNHAVGDYFMLGNVLMRATSAIATGETINASKATPVTVQSQIDTLRDSVVQSELDDCNALSTTWYIAITGHDTLNTPNKQGLTSNNEGLLISTSVTANYASQLWLEKAYPRLYVRGKDNGTWTEWSLM